MQFAPRATPRVCKTPTWNEKDRFFIETVQGYELNNVLGTKGSKGVSAWREISKKIKLPELYCRKKWSTIKYNYLILKRMILNERVTEDIVRNHLKTAKYLDGTLDFLNKFVLEIPDSEIPFAAHRFFDSAFGCLEQTGVDVEKLIKVEDNSAIIIKDYKQGTEPMSILPNIENCYSITNTQETVVSLGTDEEVSEIYEIEEDEALIDTDLGSSDALPKIQMKCNEHEDPMDNVEINVHGSTGGLLRKEPTSILPNIENCYSITNTQETVASLGMDEEVSEIYEIEEDEALIDTELGSSDALSKIQMKCNDHEDPMGKEEINVHGSTGGRLRKLLLSNNKTCKNKMESAIFAGFLVKFNNSATKTEGDCDLKEYMNNVAELVCSRLTPGKRKYFLSEVDLIVSELLEGDNDK